MFDIELPNEFDSSSNNFQYTMKKFVIFFAVLSTFAACNLQNQIDLDLPEFESQIVVECYLEPGKPYRANVSKSTSYFAPTADLLNSVITDATVIITHLGVADTLIPGIYPDGSNLYVYGSSTIVPADYDNEFFLEVIDKDGNRVTSKTIIMAPIQLDSIRVEPLVADSSVTILSFFQDDPTEVNYYRNMQFRTRAITDSLKIDFIIDDLIINNGQVVIGGPPFFVAGDTVVAQLLEIDEAYYRFVESRESLEASNGNPFGQPGKIVSNIEGGIGIFTGFTRTEETFILD